MSQGRWIFLLVLLSVLMASTCQIRPAVAQGAEQLEPSGQPETIMQVLVAELQVQGDYASETVQEALTAVLPAMAVCLEGEYQRHGNVPAKLTVRFNLSGSGKVVWTKLVDPLRQSLEVCLAKALAALRLPPAGTTLSRVTLVLACRTDHLLQP
ncbi:MAG: hypothetical protein ACUVRZ_05375 [Desulfobacca sp.]|uniref:hypothetical protein n=1 Tax=Desulfobacca sp. TaxID=2067990 RepID=UPI004049F6AD